MEHLVFFGTLIAVCGYIGFCYAMMCAWDSKNSKVVRRRFAVVGAVIVICSTLLLLGVSVID